MRGSVLLPCGSLVGCGGAADDGAAPDEDWPVGGEPVADVPDGGAEPDDGETLDGVELPGGGPAVSVVRAD